MDWQRSQSDIWNDRYNNRMNDEEEGEEEDPVESVSAEVILGGKESQSGGPNAYEKDVLGDILDDDENRRSGSKSKKSKSGEMNSSFMFFDFRRGPQKFPRNVCVVQPSKVAALLEKQTEDIQRRIDKKKESKENQGSGGMALSFGANDGDEETTYHEILDDQNEVVKDLSFESLKDGSQALIVQPGYRLKLNLKDLLSGGDEAREQREKRIKSNQKVAALSKESNIDAIDVDSDDDDFDSLGDGFSELGGGHVNDGWAIDPWATRWFGEKEFINEYTITMDIKLLDAPPHNGVSLFQTALIHANEAGGRSGKVTLASSEGECIINSDGGVGILGSYGDVSAARVKEGGWCRVVVAVKCAKSASDKKQKTKGELRTWVSTNPGVIVKDEAIAADERFAIDPDAFFVFSSAQGAMMPGKVAIRTLRVEKLFADDDHVRKGRARDKILNVFMAERVMEEEKQREGLSLAPLFPKPRPMWAAESFCAYFGDALMENHPVEKKGSLAWAFAFMTFSMDKMIKQPILQNEDADFDGVMRGYLSDVRHCMNQSISTFRQMLMLLVKGTETDLLFFLKKVKASLEELQIGNTLLLPFMIDNFEMIILVEKSDDRSYRFVIINTNPEQGLSYHAVTAQNPLGHISYRTCLVLSNVNKKNALDDVFWLAVYSMTVQPTRGHRKCNTRAASHESDTERFYDILLPFLTGKPLEHSLVEAEKAGIRAKELAVKLKHLQSSGKATQEEIDDTNFHYLEELASCGSWRAPQRSGTAHVRLVNEALHYMLLRKGMPLAKIEQVHLALFSEMIMMMNNDLTCIPPDENGDRVCSLAIQEFCHASTTFVDLLKSDKATSPATVSFVLKENYGLVESVNKTLTTMSFQRAELPPILELRSPEHSQLNDRTLSQYKDMLMWQTPRSEADPGMAMSLDKYIPVDFLQIPQRVTTRDEAVTAMRMCDRLCTLIENQEHCVKNREFLIVSCIEHTFAQVVPTPKPRGVKLSNKDQHKAYRSKRIAEKKRLLKEKEKEKTETDGSKKKDTPEEAKFKARKAAEKAKEERRHKAAAAEGLNTFAGQYYVKDSLESKCIFDAPISYALQVELLLTLQRIIEHFAAATMSMHQSRSFDGVCTIIPGCIAAVADAVIRQRAYDEPSVICCQLSGQTVDGMQLGNPGFGINISTFATQCETIELHNCELAVARTAVLDYFQSPVLARLDKMFEWEKEYDVKPDRGTVTYLRNCMREIAYNTPHRYNELVDSNPMESLMMKNYPELTCYRDIIFFWKFFLNPDRSAFPNYISPGSDVPVFKRLQSQLNWTYKEEKECYMVTSFFGAGNDGEELLRCRPNPRQKDPKTGLQITLDKLPIHRFPSTATPSFYLPEPAVRTEDDIIYRPNLPDFADRFGQVLSQRDSELLLSYLTAPYIRLPLVLMFFSTEDRIHKLRSKKLRDIVSSVLFEPGKYLHMNMTGVEPLLVPTMNPQLLSSSYGLLVNDLARSPKTIIPAILNLLKGALACDTGSAADTGESKMNMSTMIILYMTLLGSRVDNYLSFLIDNTTEKHDVVSTPMRDVETNESLDVLIEGRSAIRDLLHAHFRPLLDHYISRLNKELDQNPDEESLVDRNARFCCSLNAHKFIIYRNYLEVDMTAEVAKTLASSFVFLVTRHTWNQSDTNTSELDEGDMVEVKYKGRGREWYPGVIAAFEEDGDKTVYNIDYDDGDHERGALRYNIRLMKKKDTDDVTGTVDLDADPQMGVPEHELYEAMYVVRRRLVHFISGCRQGVTDNVMQTVMQVSSSQLGTLKGEDDELDAQNRWSKICGPRSVGRWAVANTRTLGSRSENNSSKDLAGATKNIPPKPALRRQSSSDATVAEVGDSTMLGVELDMQLGQLTLRSKHLMALPSNVANNSDVLHIFGDKTMQVSQLEKAEKRKRFKVVSSHYEIQHWSRASTSCPPIPDNWGRDYDPAELYDSETWIVSIFEPIRNSFFVQHTPMDPPTMQFVMCDKQTPATAEVVVLVGLHQKLGNAFKYVYVYRHLRCVHIYEAVANGHQWWYTMHMSSDTRYALTEMPISFKDREKQFPSWWINGSGRPYPYGIRDHISSDLEMKSTESVTIVREVGHPDNLSGGAETFIPSRLLKGALPDALLDVYDFWQDESVMPRNATDEERKSAMQYDYKKFRGYPKKKDVDTILFVEMKHSGSWLTVPQLDDSLGRDINAPSKMRITGFPGRTVSVTRRPKSLVVEEFDLHSRVASLLESLRLIQPSDYSLGKKQKKDDAFKKKKAKTKYSIDERVDVLVGEEDGIGLREAYPGAQGEAIVVSVDELAHTYRLSFCGTYSYLGTPDMDVREEFILPNDKRDYKFSRIWSWEDQSDDEDAIWAEFSDDEEDAKEDKKANADRLSFEMFNELSQVLDACQSDEGLVFVALRHIKASHSCVENIFRLIRILRESAFVKEECPNSLTRPSFDRDDMLMVDLAYPPRKSDLFGLIRVLTRIEVLGQICAWTRLSNDGTRRSKDFVGLECGRPLLDSVELPRLKLEFVAKLDHHGEYRLFSVDHGDLYITNVEAKGNEMTEQMVAGIPHSIILSNVRGETQVLVPVVQIKRPEIEAEPFHTYTVRQHNSGLALAERYFLYPVHVSLSFLLTKGINSALYLMLLRFLNRDYFDVVRLADSIATDTKFNPEGSKVFNNFGAADDDSNPDAHACRLKISSVIIDSGNGFPWDLTVQCARYAVKIDRVSTACRLSPRDELQLLESDHVATSESCPAYLEHSRYILAINHNRMHLLRSLLSPSLAESSSVCVNARPPARDAAGKWPLYADNTIFGEAYAKMTEILTKSEGADSWDTHFAGDKSDPDAPSGGWLVVACFHTLWSKDSIRLVPQINDIVPYFQEKMKFISVRADAVGLASIAKQWKVQNLPTAVLLRGGVELARVENKEGDSRFLVTLMDLLNYHSRDDDKTAHVKRRHRLRQEEVEKRKAAEAAASDDPSKEASDADKPDDDEEDDEDNGQVEWTWDPENCSKWMKVDSNGLVVQRIEESEEKDSVIWEFCHNDPASKRMGQNWKNFEKGETALLEKNYRLGDLYRVPVTVGEKIGIITLNLGDGIKIGSYVVSGWRGEKNRHGYILIRRQGERLSVPGEEKWLTERQKADDEIILKRKKRYEEYCERLRERRKGEDVECIRGTYGFERKSGVHHWEYQWQHVPGRDGVADSVGLCSDTFENFEPRRAPILGSSDDNGTTIGLHANGMLIYDGRLIERATKPPVSTGDMEAILQRHKELPKIIPKVATPKAFEEGVKVEGNYRGRGRWYPGRISRQRNNDTFDINYDDGAEETYVDRGFIRLMGSSGGSLDDENDKKKKKETVSNITVAVDTAVLVCNGKHKRCLPGKVKSVVSSSKCEVAYDFPDDAQTVKADAKKLMVPIKAPEEPFPEGTGVMVIDDEGTWLAGKILSQSEESSDLYKVKYNNGKMEESVHYTNIIMDSEPAAGKLSVGTQVAGNYKDRGKWYHGQVTAVNELGGTYNILYHDGDTEKGVVISRIREVSRILTCILNKEYDFAPKSATDTPLLFGNKTIIKCELDTDSDGGTLRFYIDGVKLEKEVSNIFEILGSTELYPIISVCPLDEPAADITMKSKKKTEKVVGNGPGSGEDDPDGPAPTVMIVPFTNSKKAISLSSMVPSKPSSDRVRWLCECDGEWSPYPETASRAIQAACDAGIAEITVPVWNTTHKINIAASRYEVSDQSERGRKISKYVLSTGIDSMWELFQTKYEAPPGNSFNGTTAIEVFRRILDRPETMDGDKNKMGFLFLYNLLSGTIKCNILGGAWGGWGGRADNGGITGGLSVRPNNSSGRQRSVGFGTATLASSGRNKSDAFRFGLLLSQFYTDIHSKSIQASIINVLGRNRAVSLRMPKFQDTRKGRTGSCFYGWADESNPVSPTSELFRTVLASMHNLRRKKCLRFAPPPPYDELEQPPQEVTVPSGPVPAAIASTVYFDKPEVTDFACESRSLESVDVATLAKLVDSCNYRLGDKFDVNPPVHVEDFEHWVSLCTERKQKLIIVDFSAKWCGPSRALEPLFRALALGTPGVLFCRIDVDECPEISAHMKIESMPTIRFFRVGLYVVPESGEEDSPPWPPWMPRRWFPVAESGMELPMAAPLDEIVGLSKEFLSKFEELLQKHMNEEEKRVLEAFRSNAPPENMDEALEGLSADDSMVGNLAQMPLKDCHFHINGQRRADLGMQPINPVLAFDLTEHDAASSMPAKSVLKRFKDDAVAYADSANNKEIARIGRLLDKDIDKFFAGEDDGADRLLTARALKAALGNVRALGARLTKIKDTDLQMVKTTLPLLQKAANDVDVDGNGQSDEQKAEKIQFLIRRQAGQNVHVWLEFMFASLISAKGTSDLQDLNPYLSSGTLDTMLSLVSIVMLRANRMGHLNRCIGACVTLESLLVDLSGKENSSRRSIKETMMPKLIQAGEDLAKNVLTGRHYMKTVSQARKGRGSAQLFRFDPRYLAFEFVWNIQLRKSQVETIQDFRQSLGNGVSKVKQMIMGAGKTSVVAPLLALIVADGTNLVLSIVPKALVEMSRTRMRETFSAIMTKRIYTLEYDRSTEVKPSMLRVLENAVTSRGIVVATPTTLKSFMLSYLETLQLLKDPELAPEGRSKLETQSRELMKILGLFKKGVALLDEVDLILHPLKSELNFPIGDKFDLDGSEDGQRWNLPIHIMDAIFFAQTGHYEASENSVAINILKRISDAIKKGIELKFMQRLPHLILLNTEYYRSDILPLVAEWCYLWLQKQHLHGISQEMAIRFMIQGAAARSDSITKLNLIELELKKVHVSMGKSSPRVRKTDGHVQSMSQAEREEYYQEEAMEEKEQSDSARMRMNEGDYSTLVKQERALEESRDHSALQASLIGEICELNDAIEVRREAAHQHVDHLTAKVVAITKRIHDLECPRDSSLDNSVVVWCSEAFASVGHAVDTGEAANAGTRAAGENSVNQICAHLEDLGLSIKRCSSADEAIVKAQELHKDKQLRGIVFGGDERPVKGKEKSATQKELKPAIKELCKDKSVFAKAHGAISVARIAVYVAQAPMDAGTRMGLWKLGSHVADKSSELIPWVEALRRAGETEEGSQESKRETIDDALGDKEVRMNLSELKTRLREIEKEKVDVLDSEEKERGDARKKIEGKHEELDKSIAARQSELSGALVLLGEYYGPQDLIDYSLSSANGRDAALACSWLDSHRDGLSSGDIDDATRDTIGRHIVAIKSEHEFLRRILLAATVVSCITSPAHKKMLNLCHNWLVTYLPHCLAKINRVSFGLLNSDDCKAAIRADPHVPRSRLKMAVPFTGKDVPSKASEFAHPDIIIGLTILAYRYSGLRQDDYTDILDSLTSAFSKEIGPARGRPANLRHQSWVYAAGGSIRGVKTTQDGKLWKFVPSSGDDDKEVVQLLFLQKSNKEQMDKLYRLLMLEPTVIHDYLQRIIFPVHMRSQRMKISASGQTVGGDMLVGRRVGFSGTPSDLLPVELGRCDYATGDDGMMISTVLDRTVASYQCMESNWTVEFLLESIATAEPRFHALIDTGALITGYSNEQVARYLLDRGLKWCEGVVFLDELDRQQVLIRATGRVVSADQCGVSLEKRFAFYDQIHTTGMDIRHVVNATAVITLGKDMVFRDYVQGAYRMRGIGQGQKVCVFVIPEVQELIQRELKNVNAVEGLPQDADHTLEDIVAWLIVNSLRSEQTQWTMLCLQNISNIYRKNAFEKLALSEYIPEQEQVHEALVDEKEGAGAGGDGGASSSESKGEDPIAEEEVRTRPPHDHNDNGDNDEHSTFIENLDREQSLKLFDEDIDFSLAAGVEDVLPFEDKLRSLLDDHAAFIEKNQHLVGNSIMEMVGQFSMVDRTANRLEQEQEREQEQEQEKEVEARKDQQIEVEKFVMREYARQEEQQRPWMFSKLAEPLPPQMNPESDHPFFLFRDFHLRHHQSLRVADNLMISKNYYNPKWAGLRRLKNVIVVMEYAPSTTGDSIRLKSPSELAVALTPSQEQSLQRAHSLFSFHAIRQGKQDALAKEDLVMAVLSVIDKVPSEELIDDLISKFSSDGQMLSLAEFRALLCSGALFPQQTGIHYVALSLAEAETIRKILHVRASRRAKSDEQMTNTELALRYSQVATPGSSSAGDGGIILDVSNGWRTGTPAMAYEASVAHSTFRFFDGDTHFSVAALNILIRAIRGSTKERLDFYLASSGVRRRLERKWQDTPLAKVFTVADSWMSLEFRALSAYFVEALRERGVTFWEAFMAIDHDNTAALTPPELYGAIKWLSFPSFVTAEDVAKFFEAIDTKRDGIIDYKEYDAMVKPELDRVIGSEPTEEELEQDPDNGTASGASSPANGRVMNKIPPYGGDEIREVIVRRRQRAQLVAQEDAIRSAIEAEALDIKVFDEELEASKLRPGGANPRISSLGEEGEDYVITHFNFSYNAFPLRFAAKGQCTFHSIHHGSSSIRRRVERTVPRDRCSEGHPLRFHTGYLRPRNFKCQDCGKQSARWKCWRCTDRYYYDDDDAGRGGQRYALCNNCVFADRNRTQQELDDPCKQPTFLRVAKGGEFSLQIPNKGGAHPDTGKYMLSMSVRVQRLPMRGAMQALVKFSTEGSRGQSYSCSAYIDSYGQVVRDVSTKLEKEKRYRNFLAAEEKKVDGEGSEEDGEEEEEDDEDREDNSVSDEEESEEVKSEKEALTILVHDAMDKYPKFALHRNDQLCEAIARVLYADDKKIKEKIEENSDMAINCINWAVRYLSGRLRKYKETLHEHRQQLNDQNKSIAVQNTAIKDSEAKISEAGQIRDTALEALDKTLFESRDNEIHKKLVEQDTAPEDVHSLFKMYTKLFALCPGPKKNGEEEQAGDEGDKQNEPDDEAEEGHLEIGARVEGNYRGDDVWYPGTLGRKCANGTFDINYDDGARELSVSKDCIRLLPLLELEEGELEEGARVEGNYRGRGKWYPGVIGRERANGTFDINYDDGERELGVDRDLLRLLDEPSSSPSRPSGRLEEGAKVEGNYRGRGRWYPGVIGRERANGTFDINYDDGERELGVDRDLLRLLDEPSSSPSRPSGRLEEGAKVEGNYRGRGRWYPGVIGRERANGTFDINYDDGERELGVDRDLVRLMDSSGGHLEVEEEQSEDDRKEEWLTMREQFKDRVAWHQSMIRAQQGISEKSQGDLDTIIKPLQSSKDIHGEFDLSFLKLNSSGADIMKPLRDWLIATISGQEHVLLVAESKSLLETLHETVPRSKAHVDKYMDKCNVCIRAKEICALYPKVQPDTWHYVSFLVDPSAGTIKIYIDAVLADEEEGIDPSLLTLQRTFVAFGGGERASNKGGDIYDLTIIGAKNLDDQAASKEYRHSQMRHVTMQESATKISASYRGHNQRSKLVLANEDYKLFYEDSDCIRQLSAPHMKDKQEKAAENYDSNDSDSEILYYDSGGEE